MSNNRRIQSGPAAPVVIYNEATGGPQEVDTDFKYPIRIEEVHAQIHKGIMFEVYHHTPHDSLAADDAAIAISISTEKETHFDFSAFGGGNAQVELIESPTSYTPGSAFTPRNMNRESGGLSANVVTIDPTSIVGGTTLVSFIVPGGSLGRASGGVVRSEEERILKSGISYILRITNRAGTAQLLGLLAQWYEDPD